MTTEHSCEGARGFHRRWEEDHLVLLRGRRCDSQGRDHSCYDATDDIEEAAAWLVNDPSPGYFVKGRKEGDIPSRVTDTGSAWTRITADTFLSLPLLHEPSIARVLEIGAYLNTREER